MGLDLSTRERPVRKAIYGYVLASDGKSPLLPKDGDEPLKKAEDKAAKKDKDEDKPAVKAVKIDLAGLQNRIIALPVAERNYDSLSMARCFMLSAHSLAAVMSHRLSAARTMAAYTALTLKRKKLNW